MTARDIVLHHPEWVNFRHIRVLFGLGGAQSLNVMSRSCFCLHGAVAFTACFLR